MPTAPTVSRGRLGAVLATLAVLAGAPACVCPPRAAELADTGFRTPEETFRSFQAYLKAGLEDWEYRCFSSRFKRENGLSLATYAEARDALFRERPWLKWFAEAEVIDQWPVRDDVHVVAARVAGRTVHVKLVREDSYEIYSGDRWLWDGDLAFERAVRVSRTPEGPRIEAAVTVDDPDVDLGSATSFVVERTWRIDDLSEAPETPET